MTSRKLHRGREENDRFAIDLAKRASAFEWQGKGWEFVEAHPDQFGRCFATLRFQAPGIGSNYITILNFGPDVVEVIVSKNDAWVAIHSGPPRCPMCGGLWEAVDV